MKIKQSIMGLGILTFALGCASPTSKREPQQSGDIGTKVDTINPLTQLKLYRTYFQMELETKTAEHIEVWYEVEGDAWNGPRWKVFALALDGNEIMTSIPENRRLSASPNLNGGPPPPKNPLAPPIQIDSAVKNVIKLIPTTFPHDVVKNVVINYIGHGSRITVYEYVKTGEPELDYTPGLFGYKDYLVNHKKGSLTSLGNSMDGWSGIPQISKKATSSWINFTLPYNVEGNTVINLDLKRIPSCLDAPLKAEAKRLAAALMKRSLEMETNTGPSSNQIFAQVLIKQELSKLPQKIQQFVRLPVKIYGKSANGFSNEIESKTDLEFPVSESPSTVKVVDMKSNIELQGTFDLIKGTILLTATRDGKTVQSQAVIKDTKILRDGKQIMIKESLWIGSQLELELPGSGTISKFNIIGFNMEPQKFLRPANAGPCN